MSFTALYDSAVAVEATLGGILVLVMLLWRAGRRRAPDTTLFVVLSVFSVYTFYLAWDFDQNGGMAEKNEFETSPSGEKVLERKHMLALVFDEDAPGGIRYTTQYPTKGIRLSPVDALIRVHTAVLLPHVHRQRPGVEPFKRWLNPHPAVMADVTGVVVGSGLACEGYLNGGERVFATVNTGGSMAEYIEVRCDKVGILRPKVEHLEAATSITPMLTAMQIFAKHKLSPDARLLVLGGDTPMGRAAVQIASLSGVEVTATTQHPQRAHHLQLLGATKVLATHNQTVDFAKLNSQKRYEKVPFPVGMVYNTLANVGDCNVTGLELADVPMVSTEASLLERSIDEYLDYLKLSDSVFTRYSLSSLAARGRWQYHKAHPTMVDVRSLARDMEDGKFMASFRMATGLGLDLLGDKRYDFDAEGVSKAGAQLMADASTGKVLFTFPPDVNAHPEPDVRQSPASISEAASGDTAELPPAPPARKREL